MRYINTLCSCLAGAAATLAMPVTAAAGEAKFEKVLKQDEWGQCRPATPARPAPAPSPSPAVHKPSTAPPEIIAPGGMTKRPDDTCPRGTAQGTYTSPGVTTLGANGTLGVPGIGVGGSATQTITPTNSIHGCQDIDPGFREYNDAFRDLHRVLNGGGQGTVNPSFHGRPLNGGGQRRVEP
jgi:hypothetical protein